jgi:hypothetical protein
VRRAALAAALVVLACAMPAATAKEAPTLSALRAVLKVRTEAQLHKDRDAYAATIDPDAPAAFRDAQLRSFDALASLPLLDLRYAIGDDEADLTRAVDRAQYGGAPVALFTTTRSLRFTYDARDAIDAMFWTFVKRGDSWVVGGDDDAKDLGLETTVSMWDTGPVVSEQSDHFLLIAHPDQRARAHELLGLAEHALETLRPRWTLPWSEKLVGFVPRSPTELEDLIQASVDVRKFVAFVNYGYDPEDLKTTTPRLFVQDANLSVYSADGQTETLVHELTHAAGSGYASAFVPVWVHEGLGDWVAGGPTNRFARVSGAGEHAPRDDEFGAGTQGQIIRAYRDSRSLIAALSRVAGANAPFTLFQTLGTTSIRAGATPYVVDDALRTIGAQDLATLERDWIAGR